jgi:peptide/nickel transport system substrate-binding protein
VAVDLWFTPTHYGPRESDIAAAVKEQLEATGAFAVSLQSAEWPDFKSSLPRGEYGAYLLGWYPDFLDPDDFLSPFLETSTASVIGSGYSDPDMDAKLQQERTTTDPAKRAELLGQIQDKLAADVPLVPLWQERQVVVARPEVRGLRLDATQAVRLSGVRLAR